MIANLETAGIDPSQFRGHPVALEVFSGPLDLLLHLVQKDRIEIWEISISRITKQYLEYLRSLEALNVEIAGEFLVMAATLMRIKSQMLLPRPQKPDEQTGEMPLTREGLIAQLLEYRRYKEAAATLRQLEERRERLLPRGIRPELPKGHLFPLREARLVDLATYLRDVIERPKTAPTHDVHLEEIRIEEQIEWLLSRIRGAAEPMAFRSFLRRPWWRLEWIVTFLAMLELIRQGRIILLQDEPFGEIWIQEAPPAPPAAEMPRGPEATVESRPSEEISIPSIAPPEGSLG
ncbi:MAG: ScpA family protein [Candidatus Eisenbacteria bacterium]|nr:segregation/condensation protein A [Candidatus Eisenbacteria bacterium]